MVYFCFAHRKIQASLRDVFQVLNKSGITAEDDLKTSKFFIWVICCNLVSIVQLPGGNNQDGYPCKASWLTSWCRIDSPSKSVEHIVFDVFLLSGGNFHTKSLGDFFDGNICWFFLSKSCSFFPNLLIFSREIEFLTFPATMQETESLKTAAGPACRTFKLTFN